MNRDDKIYNVRLSFQDIIEIQRAQYIVECFTTGKTLRSEKAMDYSRDVRDKFNSVVSEIVNQSAQQQHKQEKTDETRK